MLYFSRLNGTQTDQMLVNERARGGFVVLRIQFKQAMLLVIERVVQLAVDLDCRSFDLRFALE